MIGRMRRGHSDEGGFTLVELLVVVTILGILAAVVVASLIGLTGTAANNACKQERSTVAAAVAAYMASYNLSAVNSLIGSNGTQNLTATHGSLVTALAPPQSFLQSATNGTYDISAAGVVTSATYPNLPAPNPCP
jgi:prepilin-type N-terminal cleavage/methylation domain-containing protein